MITIKHRDTAAVALPSTLDGQQGGEVDTGMLAIKGAWQVTAA